MLIIIIKKHKISIFLWFLKDHVSLKTGVMVVEDSIVNCNTILIVIILHNFTVSNAVLVTISPKKLQVACFDILSNAA